MSEWITDRLPTAEDGIADRVIVWDDDKGSMLWMYNHVSVGQPWMSIHCKPYVKPKRWTLEWDDDFAMWEVTSLIGDRRKVAASLSCLSSREDHANAAQRICDIYNEVMP
jgi:hypothetical protein